TLLNNEAIVSLLLQKKDELGINLNDKANTENTAIHTAILKKQYNIALLLIQAGADLVINNNQSGQTILHIANCMSFYDNCFKPPYLVQIKKFINNTDSVGHTLLMQACCTGNSQLVSLLLQRKSELGLELDLLDNDDNSALHLALLNNHPEIAIQ